MGDFEMEVFAAQKRLLIKFIDFYLTGEEMGDLVEEAQFLTSYAIPSNKVGMKGDDSRATS